MLLLPTISFIRIRISLRCQYWAFFGRPYQTEGIQDILSHIQASPTASPSLFALRGPHELIIAAIDLVWSAGGTLSSIKRSSVTDMLAWKSFILLLASTNGVFGGLVRSRVSRDICVEDRREGRYARRRRGSKRIAVDVHPAFLCFHLHAREFKGFHYIPRAS